RGGRATSAASRVGREYVTDILRRAGGDRVAVYDLENAAGTPIYVHAKVCVIDDTFLVVGSDNLNRRSWTHDSEISCSVIDANRDRPASCAGTFPNTSASGRGGRRPRSTASSSTPTGDRVISAAPTRSEIPAMGVRCKATRREYPHRVGLCHWHRHPPGSVA